MFNPLKFHPLYLSELKKIKATPEEVAFTTYEKIKNNTAFCLALVSVL